MRLKVSVLLKPKGQLHLKNRLYGNHNDVVFAKPQVLVKLCFSSGFNNFEWENDIELKIDKI